MTDRVESWLFGAAGFALLAGAVPVALHVVRFQRTAVAAPGRVVATPHGGSHPRIAFTARDGRRSIFTQGGLIGGYGTGDPVRVLYDPAAPRRTATLDAPGAIWWWPGFMTLLGTGFLLGAVRSRPESASSTGTSPRTSRANNGHRRSAANRDER